MNNKNKLNKLTLNQETLKQLNQNNKSMAFTQTACGTCSPLLCE
jgi:hypothetical protein